MRKIAVITSDPYLYKKIALSLPSDEVTIISEGEADGYDAVFADLEAVSEAPLGSVTVSRLAECDLSIPFLLNAPSSILGERECCALLPERRSVIMLGKEIRLTEIEYALFSLIVCAGEKFVSREKILDSIWRGEADGGVVNVYVHYLREKLEGGGEKVIVSSRGKGYSLSEKYRRLFSREV